MQQKTRHGMQNLRMEGGAQVFFKVLMGCRPNMPESMPEGFRKLMMDCWDTDATKRPPFEEVHRKLQVSGPFQLPLHIIVFGCAPSSSQLRQRSVQVLRPDCTPGSEVNLATVTTDESQGHSI